MKTNFKALFVSLGLLLASQVAGQDLGQNLTLLYSFSQTEGPNLPNYDGAYPTSGLVLYSNELYGFTAAGGRNSSGTVFALSTNGAGFTNVWNFDDPLSQEDGLYPKFGIIMDGGTIYGTTYSGGSEGCGSIFSYNEDSGYTNLYEFDGVEAGFPIGALALWNGCLYGTTYGGETIGPYGGETMGTVCSIDTNGEDPQILHAFQINSSTNFFGDFEMDTNDGAYPMGSLVLDTENDPWGVWLYGTTSSGGDQTNGGTVFSMDVEGGYFSILHSFPAYGTPQAATEGCQPVAGLLLAGETLYGTTYYGGAYNLGTVFSIDYTGLDFTVLHSIAPDSAPAVQGPLSFAQVVSPLILSDNGSVLYGSALVGIFPYGVGAGYTSGGSVFALSTNGSSFAVLHTFGTVFSHGGYIDGSLPNTLLRSGKTLYSAAASGGAHGHGNVFSIQLGLEATTTAAPQLAHKGDAIAVVMNVLNTDDESISNVQLAGPFTITGSGGAALAGPSGPTNVPALASLATTGFTNMFTAASFGTVTFAGAATGMSLQGSVSSSAATSSVVNISPLGDLLIKAGSQATNQYVGAGIYQLTPSPPQMITNSVMTYEASTFDVELVNNESSPMIFSVLAKADNPAWSTQYLFQGQDVTALITNGVSLPALGPAGTLTLVVNTTSADPTTNGIVLTLGLESDPSLTLDAVLLESIAAYGPPALTIINNSFSITLAWPLWASNFTLETNASLLETTWEPINMQPVINGQRLNLTLPISATTTFFRLAQ